MHRPHSLIAANGAQLTEADARALYLDLLKRQLTGALTEDNDRVVGVRDDDEPLSARVLCGQAAGALLRLLGLEVTRKRPYQPEIRDLGRDRPSRAETTIGLRRLANIEFCIERVIRDEIDGDLVEVDGQRAGAAIFMGAVLRAHDSHDRGVWLAQFGRTHRWTERQPYPDACDGCEISGERSFEADVFDAFARYGLSGTRVRVTMGSSLYGFSEDLGKIAVLRVNGDVYTDVSGALEIFYENLEPGGYCIIDNYAAVTSRVAVDQLRRRRRITEDLIDIDGTGVYWRKGA